ncbi:MAG: ChaB family protein [Oscillatoriaceae bacterium SKW80]|nr:ChaB family protein [Oscillatoriaceae bacterium SKYG93]MCX8120033.1 ChaB family protein [Oscillatoriaceae bacterium SKW80]MDW8454037.1 ChaB family protein [Oscillatoriaceae cyanobacterium SKYGB_i_bin93]
MSEEAQQTFVETYNQALAEYFEENNALMKGWQKIKKLYE